MDCGFPLLGNLHKNARLHPRIFVDHTKPERNPKFNRLFREDSKRDSNQMMDNGTFVFLASAK